MAKKASEKPELIVSLMGMVEQIIIVLVNFIKETGGNVGECICHLASAKGEDTLRKIAEMIISDAKEAKPEIESPRPLFKTWRAIRRTLVSSEDAVEKLEAAGHKIYDWARSILPKTLFDGEDEFELVRVSNTDLGLTGSNIKLSDTYAAAKKFGLELCPSWVGPQLRLDYADQPLGEWLIIAMKAISGSDGSLRVFSVGRDGDGSCLDANYGNPDDCGDADDQFVFARRK